MSSFSSTYPSVSPTYQIDFSNGKRIPPNATFSRPDSPINPSNATADYLHYWSNEKHLSSENLLLQSEDFTTTWSTSEAGGSAGATAPDGGADAYTITCYTASSKAPRVSQSLSGKLSANTQYTMVGHVKAGTATHGFISFRGTNSNNYAYAQIEFASPSSPSTGGVGFTSISGTVTALGSSWYRLTLTATTGSDVSGAFAFLGVNDGTAFGISGYPIWNTAAETLEIWGAQISTTQAKVYDSPTTTSIHRAYAPSLKSPATAGAARFEHDPETNVSRGILIESQSTNLLNFSDDLTDSYWSKLFASAYSNVSVGPTGSLNADLLIPSNFTTSSHYLQRTTITTVASTTYTYSLYVKSAGVTKFAILMFQNSSPYTQFGFANVDLGAGTISGTVGSGATIEAVGNGWHRVSVTGNALTASSSARLWLQDSSGNFSHTPNGYDGLLVAGQQFEAGQMSSLISSNGSTTTRAADSLSVPTADIGYTGGPVTLVGECDNNASLQNRLLMQLYNSDSDRVDLFGNSSNARACYVAGAGVGSSLYFAGGENGKRALRIDTDNVGASLNGASVLTDTSQPMPDLTAGTLYIGDDNNGGNSLNGTIKRVAIYSEALSDTNLQSLTS